eukprot:GHVR01171218.1.p2 GENE.GHVR01171218.1~~GHVR01171218.1.p2  ORF type:complete len:232 (-),score=33.13 GHVR01171218.1:1046-1741(-)
MKVSKLVGTDKEAQYKDAATIQLFNNIKSHCKDEREADLEPFKKEIFEAKKVLKDKEYALAERVQEHKATYWAVDGAETIDDDELRVECLEMARSQWGTMFPEHIDAVTEQRALAEFQDRIRKGRILEFCAREDVRAEHYARCSELMAHAQKAGDTKRWLPKLPLAQLLCRITRHRRQFVLEQTLLGPVRDLWKARPPPSTWYQLLSPSQRRSIRVMEEEETTIRIGCMPL